MEINDVLFDEIYRKYYKRIRAYAYGKSLCQNDADCIADDTFILLYHKRDSLTFGDDAAVCGWLFEVAKRKTWEYCRANARRLIEERLESHGNTPLVSDDQMPEFALQNELYEQCLYRIKARLCRKDAQIFDLLVIQEKKQAAAAEALGISVGALKMRWLRVKPKIRSIMDKMKRDGQL